MHNPNSIEDFIGPAHKVAGLLARLANETKATGDPVRLLIVGPPGTGKSSLAAFFSGLLGVSKWSSTIFNGTSFRMDDVEQAAHRLRLTDLFSEFRLLRIEEVDAMPMQAQTRCLTLLDDLPKKTAVVCTSNCSLAQLEPRFQSRFMVLQVAGPTVEEITGLLIRLKTAPALARSIAAMCLGDVRAAINDAKLGALAA